MKLLALVCHHFKRLVYPIIYRVLNFDQSRETNPPTEAARNLHRSLFENPSLRGFCRTLTLRNNQYFLSSNLQEGFKITNDFVRWMTNVKCFAIYDRHGEKDEQLWKTIPNVAQYMNSIEHLLIFRDYWDVYLLPILRNINIPSLRALTIHELGETKNESVWLQPFIPDIYIFRKLHEILTNFPRNTEPHLSHHSLFST